MTNSSENLLKTATDSQQNTISRPTTTTHEQEPAGTDSGTPAILNQSEPLLSDRLAPLKQNTSPVKQQTVHYGVAAMFWHNFGFDVIPVLPNTKKTALTWDPWLDNLNDQKVETYWDEHPGHEVGFIAGNDIIMFDADTPEALGVLRTIEARFDVIPNFVVQTTKGEHHYFRRATGSFATSDSHSTEKYPDRLDIKTGRALVVLPPSTGKRIISKPINNLNQLSEVRQPFIDAVFRHNGRPVPFQQRETVTQGEAGDVSVQQLEELLNFIDPDCGYEDWVHVGMALYHETGGSDEGMALFDAWSRKGTKYKGIRDIEAKWRSFKLDVPKPVTIGTLIKMAKDAGADVAAILDDVFEICEYEMIHPASVDSNKSIGNVVAHTPNLIGDTTSGSSKFMDIDSDIEASSKAPATQNPMAKFFLEDITELEKNAMAQIQILGNIALLGQATVLFAQQNTGKTLIIISLIIEGIKAKKFDPAKVIYINMDDDSNGLLTKVRIADEYGFKMVADGHQGFQAKEFRVAMEKMIASDSARGFIICLDTLKKFVDTMSKKESSDFGKVVRRFVLKGGTVMALAHANKNPSSTGKTVYSGTTDIIDDFDCGYTLTPVKEDRDKGIKIVEFENIKRRGNVALKASYSYAVEPDISYDELLMSVQEVDPSQVIIEKRKNEILSDSDVIKAIEACIEAGINTKMKLVAAAAAELPGISNKMVINVIEKYTGNDPVIHRWYYVVKARGAKFFVLLDRPSGESSTKTITSL